MDPIEIIVTRADSTPTSSSTALNKIANSSTAEASISQPNLEIHFNALNKPMPNAKLSQTIRNNRRHQPNQPKIITAVAAADGVTTSSSSNYNTPATSSSDESKRPLLPSSPSSASLQLTKKLKILPSAKTSNATATTLNAPSKTTATSVPNRAHPPSKNGAMNNAKMLQQQSSSTEPSSAASPISSPSPNAFLGGLRPNKFHSMRSVRSGHQLSLMAEENSSLNTSPGTLTSSATSPQPLHTLLQRNNSYIFSDCNGSGKMYPDAISIRSLASIGMGSTDGRKMIIRRVPNTHAELLSIVNPPTTPETYGDDDSFGDDDSDTAHLKPKRQQWSSKMQFVLACVGYSIGLGNVWRFPYLCYKSGGGVFLIPYFIILFVCGIPMLFMELAVGQYTGRGPIGAIGQLCPLFKGAGMASVIISFLMSTYYSVIIAYAIYYFFAAFRPELPWIDCTHRWTTPDCWIPERLQRNMTRPIQSRTPAEEFFENKVLQMSAGLEYPGAMRWDLVACLFCAWILVYFAIWKSIKSSAKVRYFTATLPFVLIIIFLGRALTLDGAQLGLQYFFRPNWSLLGQSNVWINAAAQNFNSLGIAFGSMISFASYNKYHNNFLHDTLAVSFVNAITSLLVGIFAFATIGNIALEQGTSVEDVISDGPGLIFVVYPQAMAKMPLGQMWAILFFFMLLCLGLNSQFAIVEVVVTSIQDGFPNWIKTNLVYHELLVLIVVCVSFLFGLPNLIQGGIYYFQLIDHYAASISIMFLAFFQMIAIAWFYGIRRLSKNIKQMTGRQPSLYYRSCWLVVGPSLLFSLWIFSLINYKPPTYDNGDYNYPTWAHALGWFYAAASLICIPVFAVVAIIRADGNTLFQKFQNSIKPDIYECKICGEHHCEHDAFDIEESMQEMHTILPQVVLTNISLQPPPQGRPLINNRMEHIAENK